MSDHSVRQTDSGMVVRFRDGPIPSRQFIRTADVPLIVRMLVEKYNSASPESRTALNVVSDAELEDISESSRKSGYDDGFSDGKEEGYDEGYEDGVAEVPSPVELQIRHGMMMEMLNGFCACHRCGTHGKTVSPHHLIPESEGGSDDLSNLIPLCGQCHDFVEEMTEAILEKKSPTPDELRGYVRYGFPGEDGGE